MKLTGWFKLKQYQQMIAGLEQGTELLCNFAFPSSQIRKIGVLHLMGRVRQQFEFVPLRKHYLKSWEEAASCRPQREPNVCPCLCLHLHAQSCLTLSNPIDPPGSPVHGIFQVRTLQWVAISHSAGSSRPRGQTHVSCISSCLGRQILCCCKT